MRPIIGVSLVSAALLAIIFVAPVVGHGNDAEMEAPIVLGFDMNPAGNTCPNNCTDPGSLGYCTTCPTTPNCDCTLGSIDTCVEVSAGDVLQFDVFVDGLPSGENVLGFQYSLYGVPGTLIAQTHNDGAVNFIAQPGSAIIDFSDGVPDPPEGNLPPHQVSVADFGYAEYSPPFSKGVLGRYTLDVTGVSPGVYGMILGYPKLGNEDAQDLCPTYGCDVWDASMGPQYYGVIAVDVPCGSGPPTTTPTPTLTPSAPTPAASPTPVLTPTPTPSGLVAGWNHVCYLEAELPISEALADLGADALAVYRLRADQGFDKWFPNRPDISTITTLSPYDALFILMPNAAAWPEQPAAAPPTGLDLAQGWNSACYSGQTKDVQSATASIAGQYDALYLLASNQGWKRFIPARPDISGLAELQQFDAVLVLVTQPGGARWVFD
jgi:hypothetical protein